MSQQTGNDNRNDRQGNSDQRRDNRDDRRRNDDRGRRDDRDRGRRRRGSYDSYDSYDSSDDDRRRRNRRRDDRDDRGRRRTRNSDGEVIYVVTDRSYGYGGNHGHGGGHSHYGGSGGHGHGGGYSGWDGGHGGGGHGGGGHGGWDSGHGGYSGGHGGYSGGHGGYGGGHGGYGGGHGGGGHGGGGWGHGGGGGWNTWNVITPSPNETFANILEDRLCDEKKECRESLGEDFVDNQCEETIDSQSFQSDSHAICDSIVTQMVRTLPVHISATNTEMSVDSQPSRNTAELAITHMIPPDDDGICVIFPRSDLPASPEPTESTFIFEELAECSPVFGKTVITASIAESPSAFALEANHPAGEGNVTEKPGDVSISIKPDAEMALETAKVCAKKSLTTVNAQNSENITFSKLKSPVSVDSGSVVEEKPGYLTITDNVEDLVSDHEYVSHVSNEDTIPRKSSSEARKVCTFIFKQLIRSLPISNKNHSSRLGERNNTFYKSRDSSKSNSKKQKQSRVDQDDLCNSLVGELVTSIPSHPMSSRQFLGISQPDITSNVSSVDENVENTTFSADETCTGIVGNIVSSIPLSEERSVDSNANQLINENSRMRPCIRKLTAPHEKKKIPPNIHNLKHLSGDDASSCDSRTSQKYSSSKINESVEVISGKQEPSQQKEYISAQTFTAAHITQKASSGYADMQEYGNKHEKENYSKWPRKSDDQHRLLKEEVSSEKPLQSKEYQSNSYATQHTNEFSQEHAKIQEHTTSPPNESRIHINEMPENIEHIKYYSKDNLTQSPYDSKTPSEDPNMQMQEFEERTSRKQESTQESIRIDSLRYQTNTVLEPEYKAGLEYVDREERRSDFAEIQNEEWRKGDVTIGEGQTHSTELLSEKDFHSCTTLDTQNHAYSEKYLSTQDYKSSQESKMYDSTSDRDNISNLEYLCLQSHSVTLLSESPDIYKTSEEGPNLQKYDYAEQFSNAHSYTQEGQESLGYADDEESLDASGGTDNQESQSEKAYIDNHEKQSAKAFIDNQEKQSAIAIIDNQEKQSAKAIIDNQEKQSAKAIIDNQEKQSAKAIIDNQEKQSAKAYIDNQESQSAQLLRKDEDHLSAKDHISNPQNLTAQDHISKQGSLSGRQYISNEGSFVAQERISNQKSLTGRQYISNEGSFVAQERISNQKSLSGRQYISNEGSFVAQEHISNQKSMSGRQYLSNQESLVAQDRISNQKSLSGRQYVSNEGSFVAQERISNQKSLSGRQYRSNEGSFVAQERISNQKSLSGRQYISNEGSFVAQEHISNQKSMSGRQYLSNQESLVAQDRISNQKSLSGRQYVSNEESFVAQERISNRKSLSGRQYISNEGSFVVQEGISNQKSLSGRQYISNQESLVAQECMSNQKSLSGQQYVSNQESLIAQERISNKTSLNAQELTNQECLNLQGHVNDQDILSVYDHESNSEKNSVLEKTFTQDNVNEQGHLNNECNIPQEYRDSGENYSSQEATNNQECFNADTYISPVECNSPEEDVTRQEYESSHSYTNRQVYTRTQVRADNQATINTEENTNTEEYSSQLEHRIPQEYRNTQRREEEMKSDNIPEPQASTDVSGEYTCPLDIQDVHVSLDKNIICENLTRNLVENIPESAADSLRFGEDAMVSPVPRTIEKISEEASFEDDSERERISPKDFCTNLVKRVIDSLRIQHVVPTTPPAQEPPASNLENIRESESVPKHIGRDTDTGGATKDFFPIKSSGSEKLEHSVEYTDKTNTSTRASKEPASDSENEKTRRKHRSCAMIAKHHIRRRKLQRKDSDKGLSTDEASETVLFSCDESIGTTDRREESEVTTKYHIPNVKPASMTVQQQQQRQHELDNIALVPNVTVSVNVSVPAATCSQRPMPMYSVNDCLTQPTSGRNETSVESEPEQNIHTKDHCKEN